MKIGFMLVNKRDVMRTHIGNLSVDKISKIAKKLGYKYAMFGNMVFVVD